MQQRPQLFIAFEYDMAASASITAIGPRLRIEFGSHKMPDASTSVPAMTKYPDIIYETAFFHRLIKLIEINDES